jgi:predicted RNase H-like nuclease (RuvC/YqgF family)
MIQREVTDQENIRWTCVQAFSATHEKALEKLESMAAKDNGKITVVCTPSGGAQTVRLELDKDWEHQISDEELVEAIKNSQ